MLQQLTPEEKRPLSNTTSQMSLDYNEYSPYPKFKPQSPYLPNKFLPDEL